MSRLTEYDDRTGVVFDELDDLIREKASGGSGGGSSGTSSEPKKLTAAQERDIVAGALAGAYDQAEAIRRLQQGGVSVTDARLKYDRIVRDNTLVKGGYSADMNRAIESAKAQNTAQQEYAAQDPYRPQGTDQQYYEGQPGQPAQSYTAVPPLGPDGQPRTIDYRGGDSPSVYVFATGETIPLPPGTPEDSPLVAEIARTGRAPAAKQGGGGSGGSAATTPVGKWQDPLPKTKDADLFKLVEQGRLPLEEYRRILKGRGYSDAEIDYAIEDNTPQAERGDLGTFLSSPDRFARFKQSNPQMQIEAARGGYDPMSQQGTIGGTIPGVTPEAQFSFNPALIRMEAGDTNPYEESDLGNALGDLQYYDTLRAIDPTIPINSARAPGVNPYASVLSSSEMKKQAAYERAKAREVAPYIAADEFERSRQAERAALVSGTAQPAALAAYQAAPRPRPTELERQAELRRITANSANPIYQNRGGTNVAGGSRYQRYRPAMLNQGGGFETPEEIAMVGTQTGKVYAIAGEGPDGPGGQAVPERIDVTPMGQQPQMMANGGSALAGGQYGPVSQYARYRPDPRVLAGLEQMYGVAKRPVSMTPVWSS